MLRIIGLVFAILFLIIGTFAAVVWPTGGLHGCIDACNFTYGFPLQDGKVVNDPSSSDYNNVFYMIFPFLAGSQITNPLAAFINVAIVFIVTFGGIKLFMLILRSINKKLF